MIHNWPPELPIQGRNRGLHAWLNRLMDACKGAQIQIPHNVQKIQGHQGALLAGNFGGEAEPAQSDDMVWL